MAIDFDGTDDFVVASSVPNFVGDFTVMARILIPAGASTPKFIMAKQLDVSTFTGWNLSIDSDTQVGGLELTFEGDDSPSGGKITGQTDLRDGVEHHVAGVKIGLDRTNWKIFVDGVSVAFIEGGADPVGDSTTPEDFFIGTRGDGGFLFFDGRISDVRLYTRALSDAEIQTIATARGVDGIVDGLLARFPMGEGAPGTTVSGAGSVKDISQNSHNGTPAGSPVYIEDELRSRRRTA